MMMCYIPALLSTRRWYKMAQRPQILLFAWKIGLLKPRSKRMFTSIALNLNVQICKHLNKYFITDDSSNYPPISIEVEHLTSYT